MQKFIPEILNEINEDPAKIQDYKGDAALNLLFKHAFNPELKFELPEGRPPFKPDAAPIGMTPATFKQELRKLYVFCRKDLPAIRRESLYVQLLEALHPSEAEVLIYAKDQNLTGLYKNITHKLVYESGFEVPAPPEKEEKPKKPKTTRAPRAKKAQGATEAQ